MALKSAALDDVVTEVYMGEDDGRRGREGGGGDGGSGGGAAMETAPEGSNVIWELEEGGSKILFSLYLYFKISALTRFNSACRS